MYFEGISCHTSWIRHIVRRRQFVLNVEKTRPGQQPWISRNQTWDKRNTKCHSLDTGVQMRRLITMSGFTEGHAAWGERVFPKSLELHSALFFLWVGVFLSNVKATKAASYMLQTVPILQLQCPTNCMLKGLSRLIDCLRGDKFDFSLSLMHMHFAPIFDSRKQNYLLVRRTQMIVIKHIS